jgi:hypothetical protein
MTTDIVRCEFCAGLGEFAGHKCEHCGGQGFRFAIPKDQGESPKPRLDRPLRRKSRKTGRRA